MSDSVRRIAGGVLATGGASAVAIAIALDADPRGFGTHEQLGLAACSFQARTGWPCPGCGLTTSVVHTAHGRMASALHSHLAGPPLFAAFVWAAIVGVSLMRARPTMDARTRKRVSVLLGGALAIAGVATIALRLA